MRGERVLADLTWFTGLSFVPRDLYSCGLEWGLGARALKYVEQETDQPEADLGAEKWRKRENLCEEMAQLRECRLHF